MSSNSNKYGNEARKPYSKLQKSKNSRTRAESYKIYAQSVYVENSQFKKLSGEFNIQTRKHHGELYKEALKTQPRNLVYDKNQYTGKVSVTETKLKDICEADTIAVYNQNMRNTNSDLDVKYQQWQKIPEGTIVVSPEIESFESVGQVFQRGNLESCNYSVMRSSKLNALSAEALAHYTNGGERFLGNLVLSAFGWNTGLLELSEAQESYTSINGQKFNMTRVKLTVGMRTFDIFTPKVYLKRVDGSQTNDFSHSSMIHCLNFSVGMSKQTSTKQQVGANVNHSPETVIESTKNDWKNKTAADKQKRRANDAFLSKIMKNKSRSKYDRNVTVLCN